MSRPPVDPRDRPLPPRDLSGSILVSWAMVATVFLLVWAVSYPVLGALALVALVGLVAVRRRVRWLARCVAECRQLTIPLGRHGHITIGRARCCPAG
jgi:hypothetical protein